MRIDELSNIQSESGVIGTLIEHPEFISHTDYLKPNYFCNLENSIIYWAIQELFKEGIDNIDAYNLSSKINSHAGASKKFEKFNLPSTEELIELYRGTARRTFEEYKMLADDVVTLAFKRDLVRALNRLSNDCYEKNEGLGDLSNKVYDALDDLMQKYIVTTEIQSLGDSIDDIWDEICSRRADDGSYGIASKFPTLNEYFTYETGELVVIQAKYKRGKSAFLLNEVVHKLRAGIPTLVVDTEMQTRLYTERLLAHITGIDITKIKSGNYGSDEEKRIKEAIGWIKKQPFVHIYDPDMTNEKLYSICKMLKYKMNLQFVVYDYLKSNETSTSDNYNILGAKCDFLKNKIAGELDLAVLSDCQLNRVGEVADSDKINRYLSVGIKWDLKTQEMIAKDGIECGNAFAKVYVNRLGKEVLDDDEDDYVDFSFAGNTMTIVEAKQHVKDSKF